jgi:hypothetical protein
MYLYVNVRVHLHVFVRACASVHVYFVHVAGLSAPPTLKNGTYQDTVVSRKSGRQFAARRHASTVEDCLGGVLFCGCSALHLIRGGVACCSRLRAI